MKKLLLLLLLGITIQSNAQFACGVSERDITESVGIEPVKIFSEGLQVNRYTLSDGSILDYIIENEIGVLSVFYPASPAIDWKIKEICNREFVIINENRWHSKKGLTLCKRIYENGKWRYVCQLMEF